MEPLHILLIANGEDSPLRTLLLDLRGGGHEVRMATAEEAAALLAPGGERFDAVIQAPRSALPATAPLDAAEKEHIASALRHTRGNKRQAAHLLGIARSTLLAKVRKYGL